MASKTLKMVKLIRITPGGKHAVVEALTPNGESIYVRKEIKNIPKNLWPKGK